MPFRRRRAALNIIGAVLGGGLVTGAALLVASCVEVAESIGLAECSPAYGNWCGKNYPLAGFDPSAVDDWDDACREHDQCYDADDDTKESCDRRLRRELLDLSHSQLIPQAMVNAYDWFTSDGFFQGFQSAQSATWAMTASCEGGDGYSAEFFCQTQAGACPLSPYSIPGGRQGWPCQCGGWPGVVGER